MATLIAVYANWSFANIRGIGWGWAGVIWLYSIIFYIPLDIFKFFIRYALSGKAWNTLLQNKVWKVCWKDLYESYRNIFHCKFYNFLFPRISLIMLELSRLLSQPKRIMDGERGRPNGLWHNVHCMASRLQTPGRSSMIRTGSCLKLLNRPRDVLKLPGKLYGLKTALRGISFLWFQKMKTRANQNQRETNVSDRYIFDTSFENNFAVIFIQRIKTQKQKPTGYFSLFE